MESGYPVSCLTAAMTCDCNSGVNYGRKLRTTYTVASYVERSSKQKEKHQVSYSNSEAHKIYDNMS